MIVRKGYIFRLKPNKEQINLFPLFVGHTRYVYNYFSSIQNFNKNNNLKLFSYSTLCKQLTTLKQSSDFLYQAPSQALQQGLKDLCEGISRHFKSLKEHKKNPNYKIVEFPGFRKKYRNDSFRFPDPKQFEIDQNNNRIFVPKIGYIKYYNSKKISGTVKNVTISRNLNSWDISIQTEEEIKEKIHKNIENVIGIDVGIKNLVVTSKGSYIKPINSYQKSESKIKKLDTILAKKKKGSNRRLRVLNKIQRKYRKSRNIRRDFQHKLTTKLSKNHGTIIVEKLNIQNMLKTGSAKLNKGLLDQGLYEIKRQLTYKLLWAGGRIIEIDPAYTSQTCNECGVIDVESRTSRDNFKCVACGNESCADYNAAKNIERIGSYELIAVGQTVTNTVGIPKAPAIKGEPFQAF